MIAANRATDATAVLGNATFLSCAPRRVPPSGRLSDSEQVRYFGLASQIGRCVLGISLQFQATTGTRLVADVKSYITIRDLANVGHVRWSHQSPSFPLTTLRSLSYNRAYCGLVPVIIDIGQRADKLGRPIAVRIVLDRRRFLSARSGRSQDSFPQSPCRCAYTPSTLAPAALRSSMFLCFSRRSLRCFPSGGSLAVGLVSAAGAMLTTSAGRQDGNDERSMGPVQCETDDIVRRKPWLSLVLATR